MTKYACRCTFGPLYFSPKFMITCLNCIFGSLPGEAIFRHRGQSGTGLTPSRPMILDNEQETFVFLVLVSITLFHSVRITIRLFELQSIAGRRRSVFKIGILVSWGLTWWNPWKPIRHSTLMAIFSNRTRSYFQYFLLTSSLFKPGVGSISSDLYFNL